MTDISKHTPRPWIEHPQGIIRQDSANHKDGQSIAVIVPLTKVNILETEKANAALIAASPDMYDALLAIANYDPTKIDAATLGNIARAAILKIAAET